MKCPEFSPPRMQTKGAWKECHVSCRREGEEERVGVKGKVNILRFNNAPQRDSRRHSSDRRCARTSLEQEVKCPCDDGYPRSSCCKAFSRRRNGAFFSVPRAAKSASPWPRLPAGGLSRYRGGGARLSTRPRSIAPLLLSIFARFGTMFIPPRRFPP